MTKHKTTQHPCNFLFFDTETKDKDKGKVKNIQRHSLWFGMVWAFRYENGEITRGIKKRFETVEQFYDIVKSRLDPSRPLYVVAHNLGFDLTIVDFWHQSETNGMECTYAVLEDPPLFLSYKWFDKKIVFIDTFNFWKCSVSDMGKSLGIEKLPMPDIKASRKEWDDYCVRDVEIIANQLTGLLDFLTEYDLGGFGISAPSIAMHAYKKRFMDYPIFLHDRNKVLALERGCYYGGLVRNFFIGKLPGKKIYHVDINSLYPSVMINLFPCKLLWEMKDQTPHDKIYGDDLDSLCADVTIRSDKRTYPMRYNGRLCEVTGRFRTYLAGVELGNALRNDDVKFIHHIACYEMKPIFKSFVDFFWQKRSEFKKAGDRVKEQFVKLIMNSLYGKFGMKGFNWIDYSPANLQVYYEMFGKVCPPKYLKDSYVPIINGQTWITKLDDLDSGIKLRYLAGKLQMQIPTGEHSESFCAVSAFVTAYARQRLRNLIDISGERNTYYCDTDSLFVNEMGYYNLGKANELSDTILGKLKLEGTAKNCEFYGAKDYVFDTKTVMKGIRKNAKHVSGTTFEQDQFEGLRSVLKRGSEAFITIKRITKTNTREYTKGIVHSSGWVSPFILNE